MDSRVFGVDFSGARDAGNCLWVATGRLTDAGVWITACGPGRELPHSGVERAKCLAALVELIGRERGAVLGLDFPFGLPLVLVGDQTWESWVRTFSERYADAEGFRVACRLDAGGRELRRGTDVSACTPFSPYNLRVYRQTFYGLRDVLAPVVGSGLASVLPMMRPVAGQARVVEICPASTLKRTGLYHHGYKAGGSAGRHARQEILAGLLAAGLASGVAPEVRQRVLDDAGGDALDSIVAACAAGRATLVPTVDPEDPAARVEGCVYV